MLLVLGAFVGCARPDSRISPAAQPATGFADDDAFLEELQRRAFNYFWLETNPDNGLIRDRSRTNSFCSIAATGFGLTALGIGVDHGWITREQGAARTLVTLKTFWNSPQGTNATGVIGHRGWFYHFLDMNTAARYRKTELSSIDTALFLAGALYSREYFNRNTPAEKEIRRLATDIFNRVDWHWMANGTNSLSMGWHPESGFIATRWRGYNEAMILYLLALGAEKNPLPPEHWRAWTSSYRWETLYGQSYVVFPPLFGHQYSHCWIDFRGIADEYMRGKGIDYFENSRRATLAQRAYAIANPNNFPGYGSNVWGFTACDGPRGYRAHGTPPVEYDDGTIAPTAAGGSIPFTPQESLAALRHFYTEYRAQLWSDYGFRDAFNLKANWWATDTLGIDQGPILLMIENHRTQRPWKIFMQTPEIQRGLPRAGFQKTSPTATAEEEMEIGHFGKMEIASINGPEQVDIFYVTNRTLRYQSFVLWWIAKTNSHQALVASVTNRVVSWGDSLSCFNLSMSELFIFPGFTNVADPFSENEIRKYCTPFFDALKAGKDFPGMKRLSAESVLPEYALDLPNAYRLKMSNVTLTPSNITLQLDSALHPSPERIETNKQATLTFGRDLNLIQARAITNWIPNRYFVTDESPIDRLGITPFTPEALERAKRAPESRPATEDPGGNWGTPSEGFQLSLRFDKVAFTTGEPINACVILRNVSERLLSHEVTHDEPTPDFAFILAHKGTNFLSRHRDVRPGLIHMRRSYASTQWKYFIDLGQKFEPLQPGEYFIEAKLRVRKQDGTGGADVTSGKTSFKIVEPKKP